MITFLFEQYGYYPKELKDDMFEIDNWQFKLVEINNNDDEFINNIDNYIYMIRENFKNNGPYIIRTRYNDKISKYDNKRYVLISINKTVMSYNELSLFHHIFKESDKKVDLSKLLDSWKSRLEIIETLGLESLRLDSSYYSDNLEVAMFCLGLCINASQYLHDIILDYGKNVDNITITHKRIKNLDSFDFLNPFNFVIDHPIRDFVELYRNDFLRFEDLIEILNYYNLDIKLASIFVARILYPVNIIDVLEENIYLKDNNLKLKYNFEKEIAKIKKIYFYFKEKYNIRPIIWLEMED